MDPRRPVAEALAIKDGTIVAIGDYEDIRDHCDAATVRLGEGTFVVPGLIDAHHHPVWSTKFALGVDASAVRTAAELRALLEPERTRQGTEAVLRAWGLDHEVFAGCGFTGDALEQIAGGPALISTMDCHTYLATPDVLRLAGIDGAIAFDDGAEIVCDAEGRPTGAARVQRLRPRRRGAPPTEPRRGEGPTARDAGDARLARPDHGARDGRRPLHLRAARRTGG